MLDESGLDLQFQGEWSPYTFHTAQSPLGHAAFLGVCLADQATLDGTLKAALTTGELEQLSVLPGNYVTIISRNDGTVAVQQSLSGQSVHFRTADGKTIVSSRSSVAAGGSTELDRISIAARLFIPGASSALLGERSTYQGVSRLLGGQVLELSKEGQFVSTYNSLTPDSQATIGDAAAALGPALREAVAARLNAVANPSADFSGGVDSSWISLVAAELRGDSRFPVFYSVDPRAPQGDIAYINQFKELRNNLDLKDLTLCSGELAFSLTELSGMSNAEDLALAIILSPGVQKQMDRYFNFIRENGGQFHMTGNGGDEVLSVSPLYLADLLHRGQLSRFWQEGFTWARLQNESPLRLLQRAAHLRQMGPEGALQELANDLERPNTVEQSPLSTFGYWSRIGANASWLTPEMRRELASFFRNRAHEVAHPYGQGTSDFIAVDDLRHAGIKSQALQYCADNNGSELLVDSPFLDAGVIKAAFLAPAAKRGSPYTYKPIIRQPEIDPYIPSQIRRQTAGIFTQRIVELMQSSKQALRAQLNESQLVDWGIIDPDKVATALSTLDTASYPEIRRLMRFSAVEMWLSSMSALASPRPQASQRESIAMNNATTYRQSSQNVAVSENASQYSGQRYQLPSHVHTIASDAGSLLLYNRRTNNYHNLSPTQSSILRALVSEGDVEQAAGILRQRYPGVPLEVLQGDIEQTLDDALKKHMLVPVTRREPIKKRVLPESSKQLYFVGDEQLMALDKTTSIRPRVRERVIAVGAFILESVLERTVPRAKLPLLRRLQAHAQREATYDEAQRILYAVQTIPHLGRIACRESHWSASVTAGLFGLKVGWHKLGKTNPREYHEANSVGGKIVTTPRSGRVVGSFQDFFDEEQP